MNGEQVRMLSAGQLSQLSELSGSRKVRDFHYYHIRPYAAAGQAALEFFRLPGTQEDVSGAAIGATANISNLVLPGKFDEPFLIERIGLFWQNGSAITGASGINASETINVLKTGKLELEINNKVVYERAPIGLAGVVDSFNVMFGSTATLLAYADSKLAPQALDPMIFVEEGVTLRATCRWTTVQTVTAASYLGIYLIGKRYEKA